MRKNFFMPSSLGVLVFYGCTSLANAAVPDVLARTKELIEAFKAVKVAKEGTTLTATEQAANQAAFHRLDPFFAFDVMTLDTLLPHQDKLTIAERDDIAAIFREVLRYSSYFQTGAFLREAKYTLTQGVNQGDRFTVEMKAHVPKEDYDTTVVFFWENKHDALRVVDVSFDGVSLVTDYKNQFGRILDKEGPGGLKKKLETRLAEQKKNVGA